MSNRLFQGLVHQMRDTIDATVGVVDDSATIIACSDLTKVGTTNEFVSLDLSDVHDIFIRDGYTYKPFGSPNKPEYAVFVEGVDDAAAKYANILAIALFNVKQYYDEKYDKNNFMQNIIFDNLLSFDLHQKARELHVDIDIPRAVFYIKVLDEGEVGIYDVLRNMFPDKERDFVINIDTKNLVLIKELKEVENSQKLEETAQAIVDTVNAETMLTVCVGLSTVAYNIDQINNAYKEAQIALEVGKVFDEEKYILNYDNLGIGRLIYQLPIKLCELFLQEVFKKGDISTLDDETILTINKFFENDLNVSETSRQLFVHRNTLVYRLEKIYKLTGLDLRKFDQAIVFKVAMMVHKYLESNSMKI